MGAVGALLVLSACGQTPLQQALYGAGAGAVAATALGANAATGALVGAGANLYCQNSTQLC